MQMDSMLGKDLPPKADVVLFPGMAAERELRLIQIVQFLRFALESEFDCLLHGGNAEIIASPRDDPSPEKILIDRGEKGMEIVRANEPSFYPAKDSGIVVPMVRTIDRT